MGLDDFAFGIDISQYQCYPDDSKLIDFNCLKQHEPKISFIIARATVSWGYKDTRFDWYWQEMQRIGVCRAAYHFAYPSQDYKRQANWFLTTVNPQEHDRLAIDLEVVQGVGKIAMTDFANALISYIQECTGRRPILYSRKQWLEDYLYPDKLIPVDLWLAQYANVQGAYAPEKTPPPDLPKGFSTWLIHQTGGYCKPFCNAASKVLDYDRWNGTEEDVRTYFGYTEQPEPPTPPEPEPEPEPMPAYRARVTATAGLNVRSGAGYSYPICAPAMVFGTIVEVYENKDGWSRHNKGGWSNSAWLERIGDAPQPPQPPPAVGEPYYGPLYWQKDPRWINVRLGTGASTIGGYGCVITSEANVLNQLGVVTNPFVNNKWRTEHNGYVQSNLIVWEKVQEQHPEIIWDGRMYNPTDSQMLAKVQAGCGLVILVDHIESSKILNEHWVCSVNRGDGLLWIYDPWDGVLVRYRDRYKKPTLQCTVYRRAS